MHKVQQVSSEFLLIYASLTSLQISPTDVDITQQVLDNINVPQGRPENRAFLDNTLGGVEGLVERLKVSVANGHNRHSVESMRTAFGTNSFPESPMVSFFELFFEAFKDTTLMILIAAALVSLVIGILEHGAEGWVEGGAILIAVFLVAGVSAGNDYTKELQFRALEKSSQSDERCSVVRDGAIERVNPRDLVIGDIILLQAGDMVPADAVIVDHNVIMSNESALTGESDDLKKTKGGDCFLLSSCLITEGEECRAVVIGVGVNSQWGKIKANLVTEAVNTPLQDKLEGMAEKVIPVMIICPVPPPGLMSYVDWLSRPRGSCGDFHRYGHLYLGSSSRKRHPGRLHRGLHSVCYYCCCGYS